jgi:endonuclease-3
MLKADVLSVPAIQALSHEELDRYIARVGFHNNKCRYIKQTVDILAERWSGDIPPTAADMIEHLPGVGPKMAYICERVAWNRQTGLGVDTHMHRLFNALGWVDSAGNPERTRVQLESWLPRDRWPDVNALWVGFGQELRQEKEKLLRKCLACSRPAAALRLLKRCGLDYHREGKRLGLTNDIRQALSGGEE